MDNDVLSKINNLTNGIYAQEYFTSLGLDYSDAKQIRETLINNLNDEEIDEFLIELKLYLEISKYRYDKKLSDDYEKELTNSFNEKLLIYKLNSNEDNNICSNCKKELIKDFKYCPYCGYENKQITLKIVVDGDIDLEKGFITPEEVKHVRFLTSDEEKLVKEGKVKFEDVGIPLDASNSPYEIKNELISKDENLRNNYDLRETLFNENLAIHKKQIINYQLSLFEELNENRNLKHYPPSIIEKKENENIPKITEIDGEMPLVKPREKRKKYIKIISKPAKSKTKEKTKEKAESIEKQKDENQRPIEDLKINLKYAGILYLKDAIKHPKNPQIRDEMLYWLNISSNSEVIRYLKSKGYIVDAKGMDLIKANLTELPEKDLRNFMIENNLKVKKNNEDNVKAICENIEREKLEQFNKDTAILVTNKGYKFIEDNPQVEVYSKYLYQFKLKNYEKFYQANNNESLVDMALQYLTVIRDYYVEKMKWNKYALTYEAESRIYKTRNDKKMQLKSYINYFICMINPWNDNKLEYFNPITIVSNEELIKIVDQSKLSFKEIRELIINQAEQINLPATFLSANDIWEYFKRIYDKEDIRKINKELSQKIDLTSLNKDSLEFYTKKEQEEVYSKIKEVVN